MPGKLDHNATILVNNEGRIEGVFVGWSYTMVRNSVIEQFMIHSHVDRNTAANMADKMYSFVDGVPVTGYKPKVRKAR